MAQSADAVFAFLEKLRATYKPGAEKDLADIQAFSGLGDDLKPWDISYYAEKLKQEKFEFSSEDFRPYLPLHTVLTGCFDHFTKLFDLKFTENSDYPTWHEDVQAFDVTEEASGKFIGTLYADFHPRTGKKPGAPG